MLLIRTVRLFFGIFLYALGIVISVNANIGISPWDTFHQGLSMHVNITFGQASMIVGLLILVINYFMGIKIGFGTIVNVFGIGYIIDLLMRYQLVPVSENFVISILMVIVSMFIIAMASYFYIGAGMGTGPRDGLMVGLVKKTNKRVGIIRGSIELSVLLIGYLLGGSVGLGTLLLAVGIGPIIQMTFQRLNFKVENVEHNYLLTKA